MTKFLCSCGLLVAVSAFLLISVGAGNAATLYVSVESTNPVPPYADWDTAAQTIQEAVDIAADGDLILVTNGVYASGGNPVSGEMTNRVAITKAVVVRSVNGPQFTSIVGAASTNGGVGDGAVRCVYLGTNAVLDGFTLTGGYTRASGDNATEQSGGGAFLEPSAILTNCVIQGNQSSYGGGGVFGGSLYNCQIATNKAGIYGGGVYGSILTDCTLVGNETTSWTSGLGGGAYQSTLYRCILSGNRSSRSAGGAYQCTLYYCVLTENRASGYGGGAVGGALFSCVVQKNSVHTFPLFGGGGMGGGTYNSTVANCTIVSNWASQGAGGIFLGVLQNTIVYFNQGSNSPNYAGGDITYSCTTPLPTGAGNISNDPQFEDLNGGNLRLKSTSPCRESGNNSYVVAGSRDLDGKPRIIGERVDMGAYEYGGEDGGWLTGYYPPQSSYNGVVGVYSGKVYLAEGNGSPSPLQSFNPLLYPSFYQWSQSPPQGLFRPYGAAGVLGNRLYVAGGLYNGSIVTNLLVAYDLATSNTVTNLPPMPTSRASAAGAVLGNRFYVVGGYDATGTRLGTLEVYDPVANRWRTKTPMPTPREGAAAAVIGGKLYVAGGSGASGLTNVVERYDPNTDSWTTLSPMSYARRRAVSGVIHGKFHVVGGYSANGWAPPYHEAFDPRTGYWMDRVQTPIYLNDLPSGLSSLNGMLPVILGHGYTPVYLPALAGPVYPPPQGASYSVVSGSNPGRSGGVTWMFQPVPLRTNTFVFWGATNNAVRLSFNNNSYTNNGEVMTWAPGLSDLAHGNCVWTGQTFIAGVGTPIYTRFLLNINLSDGTPPLLAACNYGLATNIGAVYDVRPNTPFFATLQFQASYNPTNNFQPALDLYDAASKPYGSGTAFSSFTGGFYYHDQPPTISAISNHVVQVNQFAGPIPFTIGDLETNASVLSVAAIAGNNALVPPENILLGGSGSNRTITIIPAFNQSGETTLTIIVTNGTQYTDTTFFLLVNSPPQLIANNPLTVDAAGTAAITSNLLAVTDTESGPDEILYTVGPDGTGGPPRNGLLQLDAVTLTNGDTFTQADINTGRLTYVNTNRCATTDDFQFGARDAHGGIVQDGDFTVFTFRINITPIHLPFTADDQSIAVALGGSYNGILSVSNPNCPPLTHTYRLVQQPAKGVATVQSNGLFTYTANLGASGTDSFTFQANDGTSDAVAPGTVTVNIVRLPPAPLPGNATTLESTGLTGTLAATNYNNPPAPLSYLLNGQAGHGTVTITDPATGAFSYTPHESWFGTDTFSFLVTDGVVTSVPGTFTITVRPTLNPNDLLVADPNAQAIILVRLPSANQFPISTNGLLSRPRNIAIEPTGKLVVFDESNGLLRVDPITGSQTQLVAAANFSSSPIGPTSLAVEPDGSILVADGLNGLRRFQPSTGTLTNLASGGHLTLCQGVTVGPDGTIYATAANGLAGGDSSIVQVNPTNGAQTLIASGNPLLLPVGIALATNGQIYVTDVSSFAGAPPDKLLSVRLADGTTSVVSADTALNLPVGLAISTNQTLFISSMGNGVILEATTSGALQPVASGGWLQQPFGLAVVRGFPQVNRIERGTAGAIRLHLTGEPGHWIVLEASTNLIQWAPLAVLPNSTGVVQYDDPDAAGMLKRFYRLRKY